MRYGENHRGHGFANSLSKQRDYQTGRREVSIKFPIRSSNCAPKM